MDRPTYWGYMIASLLVCFFAGMTLNEDVIIATQLVWVLFAWWAGYKRVKDAGQHGAWAILTPFVLGLIIIGCLKTDPQPDRLG